MFDEIWKSSRLRRRNTAAAARESDKWGTEMQAYYCWMQYKNEWKLAKCCLKNIKIPETYLELFPIVFWSMKLF